MPVALVTGASKGIGAACAERLAADGFDVAVAYATDHEGAERTAAAIRGTGRRAWTTASDAADAADAARVVAGAERELGPLDAVVANAGLTLDGPAVRMGRSSWLPPIDVNLGGTFWMLRAALAGMAQRGTGRAVAMSSVVGLQGNAGQANYAASKGGILGLVRTLAREMGPHGVTVNAVAPGFITTRLTDVLSDDHRETLLQNTALARLGDPQDIAGPVAYLCSPGASYITGSVLCVDGGLQI
ncbi:MAG: SDR family oxidoreductase [Miltoncostaeaceae bacterium]